MENSKKDTINAEDYRKDVTSTSRKGGHIKVSALFVSI